MFKSGRMDIDNTIKENFYQKVKAKKVAMKDTSHLKDPKVQKKGSLNTGQNTLQAVLSALKTDAIESLRGGVDEIQKCDSSEKPHAAESGEIAPKPAVLSIREGNNPDVSDSCRIEHTSSEVVALSSEIDSISGTSASLKMGQKKFKTKDVFQKEVRNNLEKADPPVTKKNPSVDLEDSSIVTKKSETDEIPLTVAASLTEGDLLKSTEVENQSRASESLETTCETSKNDSSLGTTVIQNECGTVQVSTVKRKRKNKKQRKKKHVEGIVDSQPGNRVQTQEQENLDKRNKNEKKVKPPKPQVKKANKPNRFFTSQQFSFPNVWQYAASRSNIPLYQAPLLGYPPALPLMPRNLVGNAMHHQSLLLGTLGLASLIQGSLSGNQVTPLMNQESLLGNPPISPLMQLSLQANLGNLLDNQIIAPLNQENRPSYQGTLSGDLGNLSRYYENLGDQPGYQSMIRNEVNPPINEVKSEKPDRSEGSIGHQSIWEPPGNLPGGQEHPSIYQDDLLAQPSTSKSEVQSGDFYYSVECSSRKRKRSGSRDSHSPDCKRTRSSESESTSRKSSLFKLIISKDFGKFRLGLEELMLIRIAISEEIDRIPKGHIPKFNDTFLKFFGIVVDCADEWSMDWLADSITKISPWSGARLRLVDLPHTAQFYDAILFIPGVVERADIILKRLERQNPALNTGIWRIYSVEENSDQKGFNLKLGIPVTSLKALQDLNFKPFLGMTKVIVTIHKSIKFLDPDKES
ncbi:uncharacterized protein LOC117182137 [Belonocnema kinseyi]|uniref:uncharacterized protein LOC117182137 n=1 Tax=Belonocnema kinseyi TaxID=2817044 RepID=UPI00143D9602|nr:uncharacterized protein LOC117182137 [Belonocnema kinseyi]